MGYAFFKMAKFASNWIKKQTQTPQNRNCSILDLVSRHTDTGTKCIQLRCNYMYDYWNLHFYQFTNKQISHFASVELKPDTVILEQYFCVSNPTSCISKNV